MYVIHFKVWKALRDTIDEKQKEIEDEEAEIEKTDNLLKERMVALYEIGETSYLDVLFNSENILDFLSNYSMIQQIVETDSALIDELEAKKEQLQKDKDNLEEDKAKVISVKADQEVQQALEKLDDDVKQRTELKNILKDWNVITDSDRITAAKMYDLYGQVNSECNRGGKFKVQAVFENFIVKSEECEQSDSYIMFQQLLQHLDKKYL